MKLRWMNVRDRTERAELPRLSTVPILRRVEGDRRIVCECPAAFGEGRARAEVLQCTEQRPSEEPRLGHRDATELPT